MGYDIKTPFVTEQNADQKKEKPCKKTAQVAMLSQQSSKEKTTASTSSTNKMEHPLYLA